jgi:hypothetical protein
MSGSGIQVVRICGERRKMGRWGGVMNPLRQKPSLRAKRSNPEGRKRRLDCFVASLLAIVHVH